jgi:NAD(P)-dependent dehydrogenase (short-subunit alcohol dehydrogenase family)
MRLQDRVVVVVGAGQTPGETIGNGRAASLAFAREGAIVVLADRREDSASTTLDLLQSEGFDGSVVVADVTAEDDCRRLIETTVEAHGPVDVLHYNVGHGNGDVDFPEQEVEHWDAIIDANLRGFFLCAKHVLPVMRAQESGVIIGVSSAAALASGGGITYKASKAAMNAIVQSLAVKNGKYGIRVNAIMPGLIDTPMAVEGLARALDIGRDELRAARDKAVPLRSRMGSAWDVANAAVFLASDDAAYISGVALAVDGALTARVG